MTDLVERLRLADRNSVQSARGSRIFAVAAARIEADAAHTKEMG